MRSRATKGVGGGKGAKGEGWVVLKIPRGDISGVGEDEVTVAWGLHAQAERTNKQTEDRRLHPLEAQAQIRSQVMLLNLGGARLATDDGLCREKRAEKM